MTQYSAGTQGQYQDDLCMGRSTENHCQGCAAQLTCLAEFQHGCRERSRNLPFPHINVRLSAPDLFVERSVRSAWRTAEGVGDLPMTDAADRQVLLGRWSQSRRVDAAGWGKSRIATVKRPLNHLRALQTRNFVRDDFALYGIISVEIQILLRIRSAVLHTNKIACCCG